MQTYSISNKDFYTARQPIMTNMYKTKQTTNNKNFSAFATGPQRHLDCEFCASIPTEPSWPNFVSSIFAPMHGKHFSSMEIIFNNIRGGGIELSMVANVNNMAEPIKIMQVIAKLKLQNFTKNKLCFLVP